jgi:hypothetical protein
MRLEVRKLDTSSACSQAPLAFSYAEHQNPSCFAKAATQPGKRME